MSFPQYSSAPQLHQSSHMRDQGDTPLHRLPNEVLSHIFTQVVYDPFGDESYPIVELTFTETRLSETYRRRHSLLSVCSLWRNIILTRAFFWSDIIITSSGIRDQVLKAYLQRAGKSTLRLMLIAYAAIPCHIITTLSRHASQFHSLIIQSSNALVIRRVVDVFFREGTSHSLSELKLRWTGVGRFLFGSFGIVRRDTQKAQKGLFPSSAHIQSLSILRLSNISPHWNFTHAANLTELQIHNIISRTESQMISWLKSISAAPQLRDLKLFCFFADFPVTNLQEPHIISFPQLQLLTVGGFYLNDLKIILGSINPGSHHLVLRVSKASFFANHDLEAEQPDSPSIEVLKEALRLAPVGSLLLDEECQYLLQQGTQLFDLLGCIPELKTLNITGWTISGHLWSSFIGHDPHAMEVDQNNPGLPRLENLHLTCVIIHDEQCLKTMVEKLGIKRLVLGVRQSTNPLPLDNDVGPGESQPLSVETVTRLRAQVLELDLVGPGYYLHEFIMSGWEFNPY